AVIDEHAAGALGVLLIQQQLQGRLRAYQVGGAELRGEGTAILSKIRLSRAPIGGQRGAPGSRHGAVPTDAVEALARLADGLLGGAKLTCQAVALHLILANLARDALDFRLDRLKLGL